LYEKIWDAHVVSQRDDGTCLIYIDRHLVHEVTSPQAFEGLRVAGRKVRGRISRWRCPITICRPRRASMRGQAYSRSQIGKRAAAVGTLRRNAPEFGIKLYRCARAEQGIVHVVGPEQGFTLPGTTLVCGDSHTAAHGASARWPSASAHPRSSMCSRRRRCC
jgi:3-isopropylmalate/(R)-2-methylmalate dehydratase large subunit